jgi:hypothetical protein
MLAHNRAEIRRWPLLAAGAPALLLAGWIAPYQTGTPIWLFPTQFWTGSKETESQPQQLGRRADATVYVDSRTL